MTDSQDDRVDFAAHADIAPDAVIHPDQIVEVVIDRRDPDRGAPPDALDLTDVAPPILDVGAPTPWTNINPIINRIADAQGVAPGSTAWVEGGPAAYSGSSGSQASYGWKHDHKVTPLYTRGVLANYGHRPSYYLGAPFRSFPYGSAGRPIGWSPEEWNDLPSGEKLYFQANGEDWKVSGPDAEHFWVTPLLAVFDSPAIPVNIGGGVQWPSTKAAAVMLRLQVASCVGMIRDSGGTSQKPYPWTYGGRANSRILSTIIECAKRGGLFAPADVPTCYYWMRDVLLPWYEQTPGIDSFGSAPTGMFPVGTFNGLYWILPTCYDAAKALQGGSLTKGLGDRFMALVKRWSQWALDIEETVPGRGFDMSRFYVDRKKFRTGGPLPTIKPLLDPANIVFDLGWETWSFRAASVAAKVTGSPVLAKAVDGILKRRGGDPANKVWLVDADGEYAV